MNSKRIGNIFYRIIIILILSAIVFYIKKEYVKDDSVTVSNNTVTNGNLEIYFLDVGQADSILIKEDDYSMLIDAGNNEDGKNLVEFLKDDIKLNNIDIVVGTHPHEDHIGGLDDIILNFDIKKIYLPNATTTSKTFEDLLNAIETKEYKIIVPKINEEFSLNNMNFKIIYTGTDESDLNNTSIVLKLIYGNTTYLFTGDATSKTEKIILNSDIKSDVLKIGHHGSKYSSANEFLDKVNPKYAIIEVGKNNSYNHPSDNTIEKLNKRNIKIYRTDIDGTIKLTSDGDNIDFETIKTNLDG